MHLYVGTYERFLFGFQLGEQKLTRTSTFAAHQHAVKCVASGGYFLASGGADDQIHLYDIKHGKDLGFLMNPGDGAVPCIQFYCPPDQGGAPSHMLSGSADGSIAVWKVGAGWEHLKLMKGHTGSVNALTVHPSGRLALSVAHDGTMRMWDLARGKCPYTMRLDMPGDSIEFALQGEAYALAAGQNVTIRSVAGEGTVLGTLEHTRRVTVMTQLQPHLLLAGLEDGNIKIWDLRTNTSAHTISRAHATRLRGLTGISAGTENGQSHLLASAASDGVVKLWDVRSVSSNSNTGDESYSIPCLAEATTRARITCMTTVNPQAPGPKPTPVTKPTVKASEAKAAPAKDVTNSKDKQKQKPASAPVPGKAKQKKPSAGRQELVTFEIVSEKTLAARRERLAEQRIRAESDEEEEGDAEELANVGPDPAKLAKATLGVRPKKRPGFSGNQSRGPAKRNQQGLKVQKPKMKEGKAKR